MQAYMRPLVRTTTLLVSLAALGVLAVSAYRLFKPTGPRIGMVVEGTVTSTQGQPISGVVIEPALGLDLIGHPAVSDASGSFRAEAWSDFWFKGGPMLTVTAPGYRKQWLYFPRWSPGVQRLRVRVVLRPSADPSAQRPSARLSQ